ncbi:uroporphyrinogen decarboxylase family protein [Crateriforma conspicua]|uniref:Uroporphyrinogen decarboxylase n=1 Tax=Crateriforma conspicua TaxID=2527996 RepID=A0A5C5Y8S9_9PLAN|nr:uroporphyrinogen decarboxylase family protein [Crateriforma conspicua]TWT71750.1 Uroporphyrinogen decarboxylase [Crateriforma conspicua]
MSTSTNLSVGGKELVHAAINGQRTDRAPWVPFVGCHAGALLGVGADEYLKSADLMHRGVNLAIDRYQADGIPVAFDLQIEAEALGCELRWSTDTPPAVVDHPLAQDTPLDQLKVPGPNEGRIPIVLDATRRLRADHPDTALYGLVTGPFTLALHLQGTDIFMRMFDDPESVQRLLEFCSDVAIAMSRYYIEAGCDVIAIVDPMTSQIGPDQFHQFVTPYAKPVFESIRTSGGLSSFFVCGHAQQNVEAMCQCGPDNVCVDENIPLDFVRDTCRDNQASFGGNLQLTTVLLLGSPEDAEKNAVQCLAVGDNTGFVLAPGCDLPYATPPENLEAVGQLVRDTYRQEAVMAMSESADVQDIPDMSGYGQGDHVIVDIITLDSESCAPCQYMVEAVEKIAPEFDGIVRWREHKIKTPEAIRFMTSLSVKNIPTICIDGDIAFVSRIPPKDELSAAIQDRINQKARLRIRRHQSEIHILGQNTGDTIAIKDAVDQAVLETGADVVVHLVTDPLDFIRFGVEPDETPALVTTRNQVVSTERVPDSMAIKQWVQSLQ